VNLRLINQSSWRRYKIKYPDSIRVTKDRPYIDQRSCFSMWRKTCGARHDDDDCIVMDFSFGLALCSLFTECLQFICLDILLQ